MARRLSISLKMKLSEELTKWYRKFGRVAARKPYHDDSSGEGGDATMTPVFEAHPLLANLPIGAPSDLAWINNQDECLDEAAKRGEELTNEPRERLEMRLGQKLAHRRSYLYEQLIKPGV